MQIFDNYVWKSSFDELYDGEGNVREYWKDVVDNIEKEGLELLEEKQKEINWHLEDNGITYNIYNDNDKPTNRRWGLDPIPFLIKETEWDEIKKGLQQRAKLLNLIFKDLYSEQKLIKENIIPAEVIFGHKGFLTEAFDFGGKEDFNLYYYAADLARGPNGKMWIISDKTQAPSGLAYAIENRLTMNVVSKELYPNFTKKNLSPFIEDYKEMLKGLSGGDLSTVALLTPGPHNETYFEHTYLSSFLEIGILQGQDLLTKDCSLWLKSLSGLKKINTLLRRVDDRYCDPLELKNDSKLGVAGLTQAIREDNLNMVNPIGSAILENIGLNPFMNKVSQYFLKEDLILPQIATWWCGQKKELDYVIDNIDTLVIKKIDRTENIDIHFGKKLSLQERENLITLLKKSPHQYVAQEEISFSTVPYYENQKIEPRNAVIRSFVLKKDDNYSVMNGGLVRMSKSKDCLLVSNNCAISKDLWILGENSPLENSSFNFKNDYYVEASVDNISTLKAENLFWLGRYLSRSIATTRLIVHVVKKITNFYRYEVVTSLESQRILQKALTHMTMTYPGFLDEENQKDLNKFPMIEITSVIKDISKSGSLSSTVSMLSNTNINLKDFMTLETWKLSDKIQKEWNQFANRNGDSTIVIAKELDTFLIYFMAYKQLVYESVFQEQGYIIYEIGFQIEEALHLISKAKSMLCIKLEKSVERDVLEGMLNSIETFNAYRAHYRSSLSLDNVIEFLILDNKFPKSISYVIDFLLDEFQRLPKAKKKMTTYEEVLAEAKNLLESLSVDTLLQCKEEDAVYIELDNVLSKLSKLFLECSNEFSNTYFAHYDD